MFCGAFFWSKNIIVDYSNYPKNSQTWHSDCSRHDGIRKPSGPKTICTVAITIHMVARTVNQMAWCKPSRVFESLNSLLIAKSTIPIFPGAVLADVIIKLFLNLQWWTKSMFTPTYSYIYKTTQWILISRSPFPPFFIKMLTKYVPHALVRKLWPSPIV